MKVLTHRQRHTRGIRNLAKPLVVIRDRRLFEPVDVVLFGRSSQFNRLLDGHGIVGVDHEGDIRTDQFAHGFDALNILAHCWLTDFYFDAVISCIKIPLN